MRFSASDSLNCFGSGRFPRLACPSKIQQQSISAKKNDPKEEIAGERIADILIHRLFEVPRRTTDFFSENGESLGEG